MLSPERFLSIEVLYVPVSTIRLFIFKTQLVFVNVKERVIPELTGVNGFNGPGAPSLYVDIQFQFPARLGGEIFDFLQLIMAVIANKRSINFFFTKILFNNDIKYSETVAFRHIRMQKAAMDCKYPDPQKMDYYQVWLASTHRQNIDDRKSLLQHNFHQIKGKVYSILANSDRERPGIN